MFFLSYKRIKSVLYAIALLLKPKSGGSLAAFRIFLRLREFCRSANAFGAGRAPPEICRLDPSVLVEFDPLPFEKLDLSVFTAEGERLRDLAEAIHDPKTGDMPGIGIYVQRISDDPCPAGIPREPRDLSVRGDLPLRDSRDDRVNLLKYRHFSDPFPLFRFLQLVEPKPCGRVARHSEIGARGKRYRADLRTVGHTGALELLTEKAAVKGFQPF